MDEWDFLEEDGTILVQCWCESQDMKVPYEEFQLGRTASCGKPECVETKVCPKCKIAYPATPDFFYVEAKKYLQYICKTCKQTAVNNLRLLQRYGIDEDGYRALLEAQNGKCAICGATECSNGRKLHIDHDHDTGKIRGLLCNKCNPALGLFNDDIDLMTKAVEYLKAAAIVTSIP